MKAPHGECSPNWPHMLCAAQMLRAASGLELVHSLQAPLGAGLGHVMYMMPAPAQPRWMDELDNPDLKQQFINAGEGYCSKGKEKT